MVAEQRRKRRAEAYSDPSIGGDVKSLYTPFAEQILADNQTFARQCNCRLVIDRELRIEGRVSNAQRGSDDPRTYICFFNPQDFWSGYCDCGRWQDMQLPCAHGLSLMNAARRNYWQHIPLLWTRAAWQLAYERPIRPVQINDLVPDATLLPPKAHTKKGRWQVKRWEAAGFGNSSGRRYNPVQAGPTQGCSGYGEGGHNLRSCEYREISLGDLMLFY